MAFDYRLAWPFFVNHVDAARTFIGEVWQGIGVLLIPRSDRSGDVAHGALILVISFGDIARLRAAAA